MPVVKPAEKWIPMTKTLRKVWTSLLINLKMFYALTMDADSDEYIEKVELFHRL